jgi:Arylsulfotransferase (ASST)
MRMIAETALAMAGARTSLEALALLAALALLSAPATGARALTLSPLNGTPDASPHTQISFRGVSAPEISDIAVVGSRSGRHKGRLEPYASAPGASFLPARPFTQGERVTASAVVGRGRHAERVSTSFQVARLAYYPIAVAAKAGAARKAAAVQSFVSQPALHPPTVQITTSSPAAAPGDIFLAPSHGPGQSGPMIIDGSGRLVWFQPAPKGDVAEDLQVQSYRGQPVLVWWQGYIPKLGVGFGRHEIYSSSYQPIASVAAGNGYWADLHDIQITPRGSAFLTAYSPIYADLSSVGGPSNGTLLDAILQEVDIGTGLVMFEWHAYGHVGLGDSYSHAPRSAGEPWDYFHLNAVSPDPWGDGNFIISARNTWTAYEIDHVTGAILWRVGGKRSSFRMGPGTGTAWQHDVRWQPDHTLTFFDNGAVPKEHSQSRVIRERIDWPHRAVALVGREVHTPALLSGSQGNDQLLSDGSSFVGWGEEPYFTEFSPSGQTLLDGRLPPTGQSYRAYRFTWSGTPATAPAIAVRSSGSGAATVYASWNGATAVSSWRVLGGASAAGLSPLATAPQSGFETTIPVQSADAYLAVQALGGAGQVLGTSSPTHR